MYNYNPYSMPNTLSPELLQWMTRMEAQVSFLTQRLSLPQQAPASRWGQTMEATPVRLRESDTHMFCDLTMPQLAMGDIEVEVSGNRIICRTRVPAPAFTRGFGAQVTTIRGFEFFELPDGRVECSWLCPVLFHAKDVEATYREGYVTICIPKIESATPRHMVKLTKETGKGRAANSEMNS